MAVAPAVRPREQRTAASLSVGAKTEVSEILIGDFPCPSPREQRTAASLFVGAKTEVSEILIGDFPRLSPGARTERPEAFFAKEGRSLRNQEA